jgi:hypothetical protein
METDMGDLDRKYCDYLVWYGTRIRYCSTAKVRLTMIFANKQAAFIGLNKTDSEITKKNSNSKIICFVQTSGIPTTNIFRWAGIFGNAPLAIRHRPVIDP